MGSLSIPSLTPLVALIQHHEKGKKHAIVLNTGFSGLPAFPQRSLEQIQIRKGKFLAFPRVYKRMKKYTEKRWGRHSATVH